MHFDHIYGEYLQVNEKNKHNFTKSDLKKLLPIFVNVNIKN